ncbi:hypothetical protein GCM10025866_18820 [Naasia aerilata]|uniref:PKD domain-containing protein n=2 Tax=Naasia aerilata TaxID=1162966 RepID=A0ABM8GCJ7_9MICO|nr:hypothetical protein GCM10025866_18820 [Naasia aerilata]
MSGWTLTSGVTGTFPAGTVLAANARFVAAKDAANFSSLHGFAPDFLYGGNLSNGGETLTLSTAATGGTVVDSVLYDDDPALGWPVAPDGDGKSLELRDLLSDNTLAESWDASTVNGGTPKATNSIEGQPVPPSITGVTANPARPAPSQAITVTATLPKNSSATLTYKVMFGANVTVPFTDAGSGAASDGVYGASIPGQSAGSLVRYRIDATRGGVTFTAPASDDTINFLGVVVKDSSYTTQLPTIEYFMEDSVYNDLRANHREDDVQGPAVWTYNGQVIDNALMNIRGGISREANKVNWKVELPKGHTFDLGGQLPYPLDEFALQNYQYNQPDIAWATVKAAGARGLNIIPVRTQRNGQFEELGRIMETEDGSWRKDQGVDDWAIYKGDGGSVGRTSSPTVLQANEWLDKKTREDEDYTDVWTLSNNVDADASAAQQAWIYRNVNVPELINYMAINSLLRNSDTGVHNWWLARDTEGTQRWEMWHWDLDLTLGRITPGDTGPFLTPDTSNNFTQAMLAYPEFREMFFRRLRTLADQFLPAPLLENQWSAITARTQQEWELDSDKWGVGGVSNTSYNNALNERRSTILGSSQVPAAQSANANVVINEIQYNGSGAGGDWIELANPGSTAVDISGWKIADGIDLTVQAGTVLPAGGRILFVEDDVAFQAAYPDNNRLVGGEFGGGLSGSGETLTLTDGGRTVDAVTYGDGVDDAWPVPANGASLELKSVSADNADPANWTATSTTRGTPGLANTASTPANPAPTASFTATPNGLAVSVNGSASTDANGSVTAYSWNWGDGTAASSGVTASHTYATAGDYTITLTVTDNGGATGSTTRAVTVSSGTTPPPAGTLAADTFGRTATNGFGTADTGGAWTVAGTASNYAVNGGTGKFTTAAGSERNAYLNAVSSTSTDLTFSAAFNRPTSGTVYVGAYGRRVGTESYRPRVTVTSGGVVTLLQRVNGTTLTTLRSGTVAGLTFGASDSLSFRMQVTGTATPTVQAKVWRTGTAEPTAWTLTSTDTAATTALKGAGSVGLYSYYSSGSTPSPAVVSFDNLTVTGAGGGTPTNAAPTAAFSSTTNALTANVNGAGSTDSDGTIAAYSWNWGDNTAAGAGATATHTYAAAGTYTVTLTVTDNGGATGTVSHQVAVSATPPANTPPTAAFTSTVNGLTASLNGSTSSDPGGSIAAYAWQFGDGTTGTGATTSHAYATAGTYQVTLTVTDNQGATGTVTNPVTVTSTPPAGAAFAADTFGRTSTGSLGTAETGGAWTVAGTASNYAVNNGTGKFTDAAGSERNAYLNAVSSTSTDLTFSAAFNRPTSGTVYVGAYGRRVGTESYRPRVTVTASGVVTLQLQRANGTTLTTLRSGTVSGLTFGASDSLNFRIQVFGTTTPTVQAKVWRTGAAEPTAWTLTTTDTAATTALRGAGSIGLYSYYSSGSTPSPVVVSWDNLTARPVQ